MLSEAYPVLSGTIDTVIRTCYPRVLVTIDTVIQRFNPRIACFILVAIANCLYKVYWPSTKLQIDAGDYQSIKEKYNSLWQL